MAVADPSGWYTLLCGGPHRGLPLLRQNVAWCGRSRPVLVRLLLLHVGVRFGVRAAGAGSACDGPATLGEVDENLPILCRRFHTGIRRYARGLGPDYCQYDDVDIDVLMTQGVGESGGVRGWLPKLEGQFSAVSKPIFVAKGILVFCSIF